MASDAVYNMILITLKTLNIYDIYPNDWLNSNVAKTVCTVAHDVCKLLDMFMADANPNLNNETASKAFFAHFPSGASTKTLEHFGQVTRV